MKVWKKEFHNEIDSIKNPNLKSFISECFSAAPEYFWTAPASLSGKHHPVECNEVGGLLRHTKRVIYLVKKFAEAMKLEEKLDYLIAAALLHDVIKFGPDPEPLRDGSYIKIHGSELREFFESHGVKIVNNDQKEVLRLCATHMGIWGGKESHDMDEWCLHLADYMASLQRVDIKRI